MDNIDKLSRSDLLELRSEIDKRLDYFRPIRLNERWRRCGKKDCTCSSGPSDGSWGNLHGPYIYAGYTDRETDDYKQISLGPVLGIVDRDRILSKLRVQLSDYLKITPMKYKNFSPERKGLYYPYYLSSEEFEAIHGMKASEDTMGRYKVLYGTVSDHERLDSEKRNISEQRKILESAICVENRIGDKGGKKLMSLLKAGYYLADSFDIEGK